MTDQKDDASWIENSGDGVWIEVLVQPRASRSEAVGLHGGRLKLRLKAPPVDGEANRELIRFLAKLLHCPRKSITIKSGMSSRRKRLHISGVDSKEVEKHLQKG